MMRGALICAQAAVLAGCSISIGSAEPPFRVYWGVVGASENNPSTQLSLRNAPISRKFVLFNARELGHFPLPGPHVIETAPGGRNAYFAAHITSLAEAVAAKIPDPDWDGYAAIDWEPWMPFWSDHVNDPSPLGPAAEDRDWIDDWKQFIQIRRPGLLAGKTPAEQEEVFRSTWLTTTREFYSRTLQECKRLRPSAKWGFYHLPMTPYYAWLATDEPLHQQQLTWLRRANNEELSWLYQEADALFPSLYIVFEGVGGTPDWNLRQVPQQDIEAYLRYNVFEAVRVSRGKPVVPFVMPLYHDGEAVLRNKWLNDHDLRASFEVPKNQGAAGIVIWGWLSAEGPSRQAWQHQLDTRVLPLVHQFAGAESASSVSPPGGSGGSGAPAGGGLPSSGGGGGDPTGQIGGVVTFTPERTAGQQPVNPGFTKEEIAAALQRARQGRP